MLCPFMLYIHTHRTEMQVGASRLKKGKKCCDIISGIRSSSPYVSDAQHGSQSSIFDFRVRTFLESGVEFNSMTTIKYLPYLAIHVYCIKKDQTALQLQTPHPSPKSWRTTSSSIIIPTPEQSQHVRRFVRFWSRRHSQLQSRSHPGFEQNRVIPLVNSIQYKK